MSDQKQIDALLIERAGYERRGLPDRVKAVDEALKGAGYEAPRSAPDTDAATTRGRRTAKG